MSHSAEAVGPRERVRASCRALAAAFVLGLVACGGGGGDSGDTGFQTPQVQGPPTSPAVLSTVSTEATEAVKSALATSEATVARSSSLSGLAAFLDAPVGMAADAVAVREQPQAVQNLPCGNLLDAPCSGSATLDTNLADNATFVPAGSFADIRFNSVSGFLFGRSATLNGRMRLDFVTALNLGSTTFPGLDLILSTEQFGGSISGRPFGPISDVARLQISAQLVATVVGNGLSFRGLNTVAVTDANNYTIGSTTVRRAYWGPAGGYVDLSFTNWRMSGGRPLVGAAVTIGTGLGDSISIQVTLNEADKVEYRVALTVGGVTLRFRVNATYPAGGGLPFYGPPVPLS